MMSDTMNLGDIEVQCIELLSPRIVMSLFAFKPGTLGHDSQSGGKAVGGAGGSGGSGDTASGVLAILDPVGNGGAGGAGGRAIGGIGYSD